jgi:hypothetical protein
MKLGQPRGKRLKELVLMEIEKPVTFLSGFNSKYGSVISKNCTLKKRNTTRPWFRPSNLN